MTKKKTILGLDIGTNYIGWSVLQVSKNLIEDILPKEISFESKNDYEIKGNFLKDNLNRVVFAIFKISSEEDAKKLFTDFEEKYDGVYAGVDKKFSQIVITNDNFESFEIVERRTIGINAMDFLLKNP